MAARRLAAWARGSTIWPEIAAARERPTVKIYQLDAPHCQVGEGPVWDEAEGALYYVDIIGRKVHRYHLATGFSTSWDVPGVIGSMAVRPNGHLLLALSDGLYSLDPATGEVGPLCRPAGLPERAQFNDGKVDRRGRFLVGTTDAKITEAIGSVYLFTPDHVLTKIESDIIISNGPCWSPDDRTFYFSDTGRNQIYAFDYDIEAGAVSNRRNFANTIELGLGGIPDGATVDRDGLMWMAICEGAKLVAFRADGTIERTVEMPITLPSSVMFGGADLDLLFVTSIDPLALKALGMDRDAEQGGGRLWVVEGLGAQGIAEPRFAG
jgi:L-arabinonolactonase